jgi:hypothetical protein
MEIQLIFLHHENYLLLQAATGKLSLPMDKISF